MDHTDKRIYNQILNLSAFRFLNASIMYGLKLRKQYRMNNSQCRFEWQSRKC